MSRQVWKGSTLLNPEPPVLVSCGAPEKPNLITVGWTGTICTQPPMLSISRPTCFMSVICCEGCERERRDAYEELLPLSLSI